MQLIRKIRLRLEQTGITATIKYLCLTVILEIVGIGVSGVYAWEDRKGLPKLEEDYGFRIVKHMAEFDSRDRRILERYGGWRLLQSFESAFTRNEFCALGYRSGHLACVCWLNPNHYSRADLQSAYLIWQCFTLPEDRGQGLYPQTLYESCQFLRRVQGYSGPILIECSLFNASSVHGILKAGFHLQYKRLEIGKKAIHFCKPLIKQVP